MTGLPEDGELQLGPMTLPAGRRIIARFGSGQPVAWATAGPVPEAGRIWTALSAVHQETGLVPFVLGGPDGDTTRPWDGEEFQDPADISRIDRLDAGTLLAVGWDRRQPDIGEGQEEDPAGVLIRLPFGREFPGLAQPDGPPASPRELAWGTRSPGAARIGLAVAGRPADVLPLIGWQGVTSRYGSSIPVAAVLRSWEDRFGARLFQVGFDEIRLVVQRPPRTADGALRVAAELWSFSDEVMDGLRDVPGIAAVVLNSPTWTFCGTDRILTQVEQPAAQRREDHPARWRTGHF